jgi:hypothetical protein
VSYIERHFDYVLGPDQDARLASVAAGQTLDLQLGLDSDAPFLLRSRAMRVKYDSSRRQTGLNHLLLKWANAEHKWQSQDFIRQSLLGPYFGQIGNPIPVYPEVPYPRQAAIRVQLTNDGASAMTNLSLYFRGVKLYSPGAVKAYTYPEKFGVLPYVYPQTQITSLPVTTNGPVRYTFLVKTDADFVLRGGQAGLPFSETPVNEVFITMKDEDEKPYSNSPVHIDVLFGNSHMGTAYPAGTSAGVAPVGGGPNSIGLFFPEIYIPKNHLIYFDITRADASYQNAAAVTLPIQFHGMKVFQK